MKDHGEKNEHKKTRERQRRGEQQRNKMGIYNETNGGTQASLDETNSIGTSK